MIIALQILLFFRESLFRVLDTLLQPYYKKINLTFKENVSEDEDSDDQVFAEFDDEKGVIFYPRMYVQRYAAVSDCLMDERWNGQLEKVVDFGYHDMSFIKYLKEVPGIKHVLGVDIETIPLQCSSLILGCDEHTRENPLKVTLFQGNAADPDYRLIGCDAVIAIEMIEHMLPHDLERFVHTVFGFIKPRIVILTTPNADFNVMFKALENNGLRRLDHFFEWSRSQFNDWCSNIVDRYPNYTVTCKGIGPGPPDTLRLGCCSQLALFVAKVYHKQNDLDLNSLAVVACTDVPRPTSLSDMTCSFDCIPDSSVLCLTDGNNESYVAFPYTEKESCLTIILSTSSFPYKEIEYADKNFQCNLETERSKSFLFEEETCTLVPNRRVINKTYHFEDVNNRLNCSTLQVNKFSKTTQSLIAKNKIDSLAYTREVVDEIKHLTRMLNFNKDGCGQRNGCIWHNFNWGENAPYWNQYYKVVRDYSHPFEIKSEESLILDAISEEINLLIDSDNVQYAIDVDKFEIPIAHLMEVVKHITNDTNKVKDLLEWNGYQVVDDVLIHSRLVVDTISAGLEEDEWLDNDTLSDNATYVGRSIIKYESYARSCRKTRILPASWTA
ncbi:small RNA 2'-O-methyltransferase isoform X2 [Leptidea sinapis]|uniref:small RNA 2'-O-methyltransferase isoform X2 n=1 Tax=Leptidea sinapis TaxID=189913 RepID=UPI0021C4C51A|nr:small RNA 2'-O-methyltransferase isoform X2 [Leptidea sinapis]